MKFFKHPQMGVTEKYWLLKSILIMKLTLLLILLFNLNVVADVYSQTKVTLNLKSARFKTIISSIEKQSSYHFVYSENKIPGEKNISINVENTEVTAVLDQVLANSGFTYNELQNHLVVITRIGVTVNAVTVKGKVLDEKGQPLPGASIKVKGSQAGTVTDLQGDFSIDVPDGGVLLVSYIGYQTKEVTVNGNTPLTISLVPSGTLNEVVVTALGIKKEAKTLGYSVQKVSGQDITKADAPNVGVGLAGKVAGLNVTMPTGIEGGSTRIIIRGNSSFLGNNQPLIVVDGIMIDNEPIVPGSRPSLTIQNAQGQNNDVSSNQGVDYGSFLNTINMDDVADINVLKGPAAATKYGARGSNGVILITTKKGGKEKGLGINYNFSMRTNNPYRYVDQQNQYGMGGTDALFTLNSKLPLNADGKARQMTENDGDVFYGSTPDGVGSFPNYIGYPGDGMSWGPKFNGQPVVDWDGVTRPYNAQPNNFKSFYKNGNTYTNNISFSGGGDIGTIRVSYTRTTNDAITYNSNSNQNVFNIGSSLNISSKLKAEVSASYTNLNKLNTPDVTYGPSYMAMYVIPRDYIPLEKTEYRNPDGSKNLIGSNSNYPYPSGGLADYWWNTFENHNLFTQNQFLGSLRLTAEILPWLTATANGGIDYYNNQFENKTRPTDVTGLLGAYSNDLSRTSTTNLDGMLTAHKDNLLKNFDAGVTLGASYYQNKFYDIAGVNKGPFGVPFLYNLSNYSGILDSSFLPKENRLESEISSLYGIANFAYKRYLFLELSARNDRSSTLPTNNLSFTYPGASLSFVFTDAFNMGSVKNWLDFGKIRVARASSASGYIPYLTMFNYNSFNYGGTSAVTVPTTIPSQNLKPQTSRSTEVGTSLSFFGNKLNFDFTYYNIYSYNQILQLPVATSSGADNITTNSGALRNKGFEFIINAKIINNPNGLKWDIGINGAHNNNKVVSLAPNADQLALGSLFGGNGISENIKVGDNYGTIYGYNYVYKNGQPVVDLTYNNAGQAVAAKYEPTPGLVKIGDANPHLTGGISNTFTYKNWSLYVMTDFKVGGQIYSADYATLMGQGELPETLKERNGGGLPFTYPDGTKANVGVILPGVLPDGTPNTAVVNYIWKYASNFQSWSNVPMVRSNAIFNNSWGKLRELSISYKVPDKFLKKSKIVQSLTVSLIGRDLFYLFTTLPDHLNPEGTNGTTNVQGIQWDSLPGVRSFGFSLKAGF